MTRIDSRSILVAGLLAAVAACDEGTTPENEQFIATLTGASEVPPVVTDASGEAVFELLDDGTIAYRITVADIDSIVASHIHGPAGVGVNAGVLVSLFPTASGQAPTGVVDGVLVEDSFAAPDVISMDSLLVLLRAGNTYVNVHTRQHGPGEIRGQILPR